MKRTWIWGMLFSLLLAGCAGPPRDIERETERLKAERQEAIRLAAERQEAVRQGKAQPQPYNPNNRMEYLAKVEEAKAYYQDKCENVAGIRIHRTVPDVEGVLLLKVRPERSDRQLADPMWPGAAFGEEYRGDSYIQSFLGNEYGKITKTRGYINVDRRPGGLPGYRWVEVIDPKDGQRYRYSLEYKEVTHISSITIGGTGKPFTVMENALVKTPSPSPTPPRYAVTFEDHVIPEERAMWVASSTVKVLDFETDEVLGELTRYAISYIHTPVQSMPWLNHSICPYSIGGVGTNTRQFVDQVLLPKKEK
ncbi:MAG: hypothetical protein LBE81_02350 [Azonexus sp.]|jgi:hypothetical protein|uniref:hypothetical protein n=1 Tax=Azonexus sp. TaxID=1872668 RepID=UPI002832342E|nr:hypothetical protein [Azonexus sp.]MDR0775463.1 hypothetical protein [Azonexus sp.]